MISRRDHLPSTEAAVTALRAFADTYGRQIEVTHDIGADQTSRRTAAGAPCVTDTPTHPLAERTGAVTREGRRFT